MSTGELSHTTRYGETHRTHREGHDSRNEAGWCNCSPLTRLERVLTARRLRRQLEGPERAQSQRPLLWYYRQLASCPAFAIYTHTKTRCSQTESEATRRPRQGTARFQS